MLHDCEYTFKSRALLRMDKRKKGLAGTGLLASGLRGEPGKEERKERKGRAREEGNGGGHVGK